MTTKIGVCATYYTGDPNEPDGPWVDVPEANGRIRARPGIDHTIVLDINDDGTLTGPERADVLFWSNDDEQPPT